MIEIEHDACDERPHLKLRAPHAKDTRDADVLRHRGQAGDSSTEVEDEPFRRVQNPCVDAHGTGRGNAHRKARPGGAPRDIGNLRERNLGAGVVPIDDIRP